MSRSISCGVETEGDHVATASILVVDDEPAIQDILTWSLAAEGYSVATAGSGEEALTRFGEQDFDVIVTDIVMPGLDGIAATVALIADRPDTRVVLVTAFNGPEMTERGYAAGALAHVSKHRAGHELLPAVRAAVRGERYVSPRHRP